MCQTADHHSIHYLEIPTNNIAASKAFFARVFDWQFVDYGEHYTAFTSSNLEGGLYTNTAVSNAEQGASLVVFFSHDLAQSLTDITQAGGQIKQDIFAFPGGRRFHFTDPGGSEFAVWAK